MAKKDSTIIILAVAVVAFLLLKGKAGAGSTLVVEGHPPMPTYTAKDWQTIAYE